MTSGDRRISWLCERFSLRSHIIKKTETRNRKNKNENVEPKTETLKRLSGFSVAGFGFRFGDLRRQTNELIAREIQLEEP